MQQIRKIISTKSLKKIAIHENLDPRKFSAIRYIHHMSNSRECMGVNGEALQLHAVHKMLYLYYKSLENLYQVL